MATYCVTITFVRTPTQRYHGQHSLIKNFHKKGPTTLDKLEVAQIGCQPYEVKNVSADMEEKSNKS